MSGDPFMAELNRFLGEKGLLPVRNSAGYRYWALSKKESGGRWDREFGWTPKRANGRSGPGFYAVEYVVKGDRLELVRSVRFARRRVAKARAQAWYEAAKAAAKKRSSDKLDAAVSRGVVFEDVPAADPDGRETYGTPQRDGLAEDDA